MRKENNGNTAFLTHLYSTHSQRLWGYAYRLTSDKNLADDTVQTVFTNIIKHVEMLKKLDDNRLKAYLNTAVRNTFYNHCKRAESTIIFLELEQINQLSESENFEDNLFKLLDIEQIKLAMEHLFEREKDIITLYYFEDLSHAQIAEVMEITANHVGVLLHRSIQKLKKIVLTGGEMDGEKG